MDFPRFTREAETVPPEVQARRDEFRLVAERRAGITPAGPDFAASLGRDLFARYGKDWPSVLAEISAAAMRAERDALNEVFP